VLNPLVVFLSDSSNPKQFGGESYKSEKYELTVRNYVSDTSLGCRIRVIKNSGSENLFPLDAKRTNFHQNMRNIIPKSL
jgi:hypothetical protein